MPYVKLYINMRNDNGTRSGPSNAKMLHVNVVASSSDSQERETPQPENVGRGVERERR